MLTSSLARAAGDGSGISYGVVRIAVLGDYGSGRDLGGPGSVTAAKLAAEDFHNTVLGKPIEIISADHQNKPDVAVGIARQWFDVEHVDAVTDLAVSSVGLAVAVGLCETVGSVVTFTEVVVEAPLSLTVFVADGETGGEAVTGGEVVVVVVGDAVAAGVVASRAQTATTAMSDDWAALPPRPLRSEK